MPCFNFSLPFLIPGRTTVCGINALLPALYLPFTCPFACPLTCPHLPSPALLPALTCPALAERGLKRVLCDGKCGLAASRNKAHAAHESILIIPDISSTCVPPLLQSLYLIGKSGIVLECLIKNPSKYRVLLNRRGALLGKSTSILNESLTVDHKLYKLS